MGHIEIVKVLLNNSRVDLNVVDTHGLRALERCCANIHKCDKLLEIAELLLNHPQTDLSLNAERNFYRVIFTTKFLFFFILFLIL